MPDKPPGIHVKKDARLGLDPARIIPESVTAEFREDPDGVPLEKFVEAFGGHQGSVIDPFGRELSFSLEKWRNAPATMRLGLSLTYRARPGVQAK